MTVRLHAPAKGHGEDAFFDDKKTHTCPQPVGYNKILLRRDRRRMYIIVLSNSFVSKLPHEFYGGDGSSFLVQQEINVLSFIVSSRYHFCDRLRYRGATSEITSVCLFGTARRGDGAYTSVSGILEKQLFYDAAAVAYRRNLL